MNVINLPNKQSGFTILEMLFAVGLMAVIVQTSLYILEGQLEKASASRTISAIDEITSSLYSYRVDEANKVGGVGTWPTGVDADNNFVPDVLQPYLPNNDPRTGNGESFTLVPVTDTLGPMYSITAPAFSEYEANIIAQNYPASATINLAGGSYSVVRIVQRPGGETSNTQFVLKDGTRDVDGNLTFNSGATFELGEVMNAEVTTTGEVHASRFEQLQNTGNLLWALELKASGGGLTNPDLYGQSGTLVLGSSSSNSEIRIQNNQVDIPGVLLNQGTGSRFESDTAIIGNLTVDAITIR
jgi:type II secretory pathway pseudopilin PulG